MSVSLRTALPIVAATLLASAALAQNATVQPNQTPAPAEMPAAGGFSPDQTRAIEGIVKNYLVQHPEVLQDAMDALDKRQKEADAEKARTTI